MNDIFKEGQRLYSMGFAIHWLMPKSKRPVETGWTTGKRKSWDYLKETFNPDLNIGVRLGEPSYIPGLGYLSVLDLDVKSTDIRHRKEALAAAKKLLGAHICPVVLSGRGNGSRHFYFLSPTTFKSFNPVQSEEKVKAYMPSKKPSKEELSKLTPTEISNGIRLARAWEISLMSTGRQVVLPPSIHPDSGELYAWGRKLNAVSELPIIEFDAEEVDNSGEAVEKPEPKEKEDAGFTVEDVDLGWVEISKEMRGSIVDGTGVSDRSAFLLPAASALHSAGLTQNEILNVLTDPKTFLGACSYEHAQTKSRKRAADWVYKYTLKKVLAERDATAVFTALAEIEDIKLLSDEDAAKQAAEFEEERNWRDDLVRTQHGDIRSTINNFRLITENMVEERIIQRDTFAYRDTYRVDVPWGAKAGDLVGDDDVPMFKDWMEKQFGVMASKPVVEDFLTVTAKENSYDPVQDWFSALPDWDRTPRLDTWLKNNFEAEGPDIYLAEVFRKWMVAMVMRVFEPGAKFDWMPIFEGGQGVGKSSFGRMLCGDKYFVDWLPNLADKDAALGLQGMLVVEMGELSQFKKNELEVIKNFITRQTDKFRPPFGRKLIDSHRRCVFFGTTNKDTYLKDDTGNRRFKPVKVGRLNFNVLESEREQLFAEAKYLYDSCFETQESIAMLSKDAKDFEAKIHGEKMVTDESDAMAEFLQDFFDKVDQESGMFDLEKFSITSLFEGIGPLQKWRPTNANMQFAGKALTKLGFEKRKVNGKIYWKGIGYLSP